MRRLRGFARSGAFWFAVFYIVMIPAFAIGYDSLGHDAFHDSNAEREKGAYQDASELRGELSHALVAHLGSLRWHSSITPHVPVVLHRDQVGVTGIEYTTSGRLLLEVSGVYSTLGPTPLLTGSYDFWVEPQLREPASAIEESGRPLRRLVPVALSRQAGSANEEPHPSRFNPPVSVIFPIAGGGRVASSGGLFAMSDATYVDLEDYFLALDGDPSYASDHLARMLYLSAVTITTLGFGDITPVTEAARLLIAAEAVLGIIVIGGFLSLLARGRRRVETAG